MRTGKRQWLLTGVACVGATLMLASTESSPAVPPQDLFTLDRRVSTMEQRIISLESRLIRLEQQSMLGQRSAEPSPAGQITELNLLRSELQVLGARIRLLECGVVRLDERTTSEQAREARKKSGPQTADPCRLNPEAPLQFPAR
ncbi:MAG TPA: hypothetical protein VFD58_07670 [Blastocatellia bacterium]|nr:hypothetical protein [Blastocatellia bacterium]